jgi:hypothetical protein
MSNKNECLLYDKKCNDCGECNICDLNSKKTCDNCCKCLEADSDFRGVYIDEIIDDKEEPIEDSEDLALWKFDENVVEE